MPALVVLAWHSVKAQSDTQLGTHHSYACTYPLPYSSEATVFFFFFLFRLFAGAAGGSSLIPERMSEMPCRFAAASTASAAQSLRVAEQNAARPASSRPPGLSVSGFLTVPRSRTTIYRHRDTTSLQKSAGARDADAH